MALQFILWIYFQESFWAIGNTTGGEELQPFTSVGLNASAINSSFEGILQHNHTYYVSIRCVNGGGQATQWNDTTGQLGSLIVICIIFINEISSLSQNSLMLLNFKKKENFEDLKILLDVQKTTEHEIRRTCCML